MPASVATRNDTIDHLFRTAAWAKPTQLHVALFTALGEVPGFGYQRLRLDPSNANWNRPSDGVATNAVELIYPDPVGGSWGTIIEGRVYDQNGIERLRGTLTAQKTVNEGDPGPKFPAGSIVFTIPG